MDVVWLPSYPKSGNTWVRFLLTNLIHGPFESSQTIFDITPVLERGVNSGQLCNDRANVIKTHQLFSPGLPLMEYTRGVIYVVRDPFDVMLSNLNYHFVETGASIGKSDEELQKISDDYVQNYLELGGHRAWARNNNGTWTEHARSWIHNSAGIPVKLVRYEALKADAVPVLREICTFLELEATDEQLRQAVERSSFEKMRALEEREIRHKIPGMFFWPKRAAKIGDPGVRFMNEGKAGLSRQRLGVELRQSYQDSFAPMIAELGYA